MTTATAAAVSLTRVVQTAGVIPQDRHCQAGSSSNHGMGQTERGASVRFNNIRTHMVVVKTSTARSTMICSASSAVLLLLLLLLQLLW